MNLLISASPRSKECAEAIEEITQSRTNICNNVAKAATLARSSEYTAIIFDQAGMSPDPVIADEVLRNAGLAVPVYVNSALMSAGRITAELRSTLARIEREKRVAMQQAEVVLRNDLKGEITGILIAAELALESAKDASFVLEKLRDIAELATRMRGRFHSVN